MMLGICRASLSRGFGGGKIRAISTFAVVRTESPNPRAARFVPFDGRVRFIRPTSSKHAIEFKNLALLKEDAEEAALAVPSLVKMLRDGSAREISNVLVGKDFVSVTFAEDLSEEDEAWDEVEQLVANALQEDLGNDKWKDVLQTDAEERDDGEPVTDDDEVVELIKDLLDERVRPNLNLDGGDVEFRGFDKETGVVKLRLVGACVSCPSSTSTLHFGVKNLLTHMVEEVKDVEQVFDEDDFIQDKGQNWTG